MQILPFVDVRMDFMFTFNKYLILFLMIGCSIEPDPNEYEARTDVGLVRGHAYSLTKVGLMMMVMVKMVTIGKGPCFKQHQSGDKWR